ncbi:hypothetical protein [Desulfomicrobium salsuginis]
MPASWHKQEHVAIVQLEQAIRLFLDEQDYYSAATLAGSSEEISGRIALNAGKLPVREERMRDLVLNFSRNQICAILELKKLDSEEIALEWILYKYTDWLKHYREENSEIYINTKAAAYELITRALSNLSNCGKTIRHADRFREYAMQTTTLDE